MTTPEEGLEKAALLLMTLGPDAAAGVLRQLGPREVLVERWAGRDARRNPDAEGAPAPPPQQDEYLDLLVRVRDAGPGARLVFNVAGYPRWQLFRGERELESVFLELSGPADGKKKKKKKRAAADDAPPPAPQQEAES